MFTFYFLMIYTCVEWRIICGKSFKVKCRVGFEFYPEVISWWHGYRGQPAWVSTKSSKELRRIFSSISNLLKHNYQEDFITVNLTRFSAYFNIIMDAFIVVLQIHIQELKNNCSVKRQRYFVDAYFGIWVQVGVVRRWNHSIWRSKSASACCKE